MKQFFKEWRPYIAYGVLFSMFINLLQLTFPIYMLQIYDRVLTSYSMSTLAALTVAASAALMVMASLEFIRSRLLVRCGVAIDHALSRNVLDAVVKQAAFSGGPPQPATLRDVNVLRNFFAGSSIFTLFDAPWTPLFLAVIYFIHPLLGIVATFGAVLLLLFALINEVATQKPLTTAGTVNGFSMNFVETARRNAPAVRSMGMLGNISTRWQEFNDVVTQLQTQASRRAGLMQSLSSLLRQSMQVAIFATGAWLTLRGEATPGVIIASSIIMGRALAPVQGSIATWKSVVDARAAWKRLDVLFSQPKVQEEMDLPAPKGQLSVEQVGFALQNAQILRGINFSLQPGESLGLIGPSGAGKSTLCQLLLGIWPATIGKVRLDGNDLYLWNQEKIGAFFGYLPQDVDLFAGTVAENIARMGQVDSDKVIAAAHKAGVHEMVLAFPKGYDTRIGQGGVILSGGQRQRIGLARAMYGEPKVVILDEPNSNLDSDGEAALLRAFAQLKEEETTLVVVSHKVSLLASLDKILMLQNGLQTAFGSREAVFRKLLETQSIQQPQGKIAAPIKPAAERPQPLAKINLEQRPAQL